MIHRVSYCLLLICSFAWGSDTTLRHGPDPALSQAIDQISCRLETDYGLSFSGFGEKGSESRLSALTLYYKGSHLIEIDAARDMIIECTSTVLRIINASKDLRPLLSPYPFTPNNLKLSLIYSAQQPVDPHVASIAICNGEVCYRYREEGQRFFFSRRVREPFEKAVTKVHTHRQGLAVEG